MNDDAPLPDFDNPDWHCTVHGTWGNGDYACFHCQTDDPFLATW